MGDIVDKETLEERNFCFPIRKKRLQPLQEQVSNFNAMFGGFRSMSEATFGDLIKTILVSRPFVLHILRVRANVVHKVSTRCVYNRVLCDV